MSWRAFSAQHTEHLGVPKGPPKDEGPTSGKAKTDTKGVAATQSLFFLAFVSVAHFQARPKREPKAFAMRTKQ